MAKEPWAEEEGAGAEEEVVEAEEVVEEGVVPEVEA